MSQIAVKSEDLPKLLKSTGSSKNEMVDSNAGDTSKIKHVPSSKESVKCTKSSIPRLCEYQIIP